MGMGKGIRGWGMKYRHKSVYIHIDYIWVHVQHAEREDAV